MKTITPNRKVISRRARKLRETVKGQGRSFVWLARVTGYSENHINKVVNGRHRGSERFFIAAKHALGEDFAA